jgi:hypothetical protein
MPLLIGILIAPLSFGQIILQDSLRCFTPQQEKRIIVGLLKGQAYKAEAAYSLVVIEDLEKIVENQNQIHHRDSLMLSGCEKSRMDIRAQLTKETERAERSDQKLRAWKKAFWFVVPPFVAAIFVLTITQD